MDRQAIEKEIQEFLTQENLYLDQITLHHGAALVFHNVKHTATDIDLDVPSDVFVRLREKYTPGRITLKHHDDLPFHHPAQFIPYLAIGNFEIFQEIPGKVVLIDDYPVYALEEILKAKQDLNRERDQVYIRSIMQRLQSETEYSI